MKERILNDTPFFGRRYGNSELTACFIAELCQRGIIDRIEVKELRTAKSGPGVFPETEAMYLTFAEHYTEALKSANANAYRGYVPMEGAVRRAGL